MGIGQFGLTHRLTLYTCAVRSRPVPPASTALGSTGGLPGGRAMAGLPTGRTAATRPVAVAPVFAFVRKGIALDAEIAGPQLGAPVEAKGTGPGDLPNARAAATAAEAAAPAVLGAAAFCATRLGAADTAVAVGADELAATGARLAETGAGSTVSCSLTGPLSQAGSVGSTSSTNI
jgi:hypothetical protein